MKLLLILTCFSTFLVFNVHADWSVGQFLASHHYNTSGVTNENHINSFYACYDNYCTGFYENSYSTQDNPLISRFALYQTNSVTWAGIKFNAVAGIIDGYKGINTDDQYIPILGATAIIGPVKFWQIGRISAVGWEFSLF